MSKLATARVAAGTAAGALVCGAVISCAAIWDIEEPLPLLDGGGADGQVMDSTIPVEEESSIDAGPGDALHHDADSALSDEPDAPPVPAGYTVTFPPSPTFVDACNLSGAAKNLIVNHTYADTGPLTLPIAFDFYRSPQTQYWANTQGIVGFGTTTVHNANVVCPLPSTTHVEAHPAIYAFADNIQTGTTTGVCIGVTGTKPNQLVITWEDANLVSNGSSHLTFSVVLTETTNTIDLLYGTMSGGSEAQGSLALIGLEDQTGALAITVSCMSGTPLIKTTPFAIRFTPNP